MRQILTVVVAAAVLLLPGCADRGETAAPPSTSRRPPDLVRVTITQGHQPGQPGGPLLVGSELKRGQGCYSFGIDKSTFLTVEGADGDVIATASISPGVVAQVNGDAWNCWWNADVAIPESQSYAILVGGVVMARRQTIDRSAGLSVAFFDDTQTGTSTVEPAPA